jgi:hypothetical protein
MDVDPFPRIYTDPGRPSAPSMPTGAAPGAPRASSLISRLSNIFSQIVAKLTGSAAVLPLQRSRPCIGACRVLRRAEQLDLVPDPPPRHVHGGGGHRERVDRY